MMEQLISQHHTKCYDAFSQLMLVINTPSHRFARQINLPDVVLQFDRYILWAGNVGAPHSGKNYNISLDYRLREASFYKDKIIKLLERLHNTILRATLILEGKETPFEDIPVSQSPFSSMHSSEISSEESSDSESRDESSQPEGDGSRLLSSASQITTIPSLTNFARSNDENQAVQKGVSKMEIQQLLHSIQFIVSCLYKTPIRKTASSDRFAKYSIIDVTMYEPFDSLYIEDKFPNAHPELQRRMAKMVSRRRQVFLFRKAHRDRLKPENIPKQQHHMQTAENPADIPRDISSIIFQNRPNFTISRSDDVASSQQPSTKATTWKARDFAPIPEDSVLFDEESVAETSMSVSTRTGMQKLKLPPRPKNVIGEELTEFECPYCMLACTIRSDHSWKRHVFKDLEPYICTFGNCTKSNDMFDNREQWFEHELQEHRIEWSCNTVGHSRYNSRRLFLAHLHDIHDTFIDPNSSSTLLKMYQQPSDEQTSICPLCLEATSSLKSHLSRHFEQVALFSLPRYSYAVDDNSLGAVMDSRDQSSRDQSSSLHAIPGINSSISLSRPALPSLPNLPLYDAVRWKLEMKQRGVFSRRKNVPRDDMWLLKRLIGREYVFLIDDSASMGRHWKNVREVCETLAYMVKEKGPDGFDVYFTVAPETHRGLKRTTNLEKLLEKKLQTGITDMEHSLSNLFTAFKSTLRPSTPNSRSNKIQGRPISLYVFTNGVWDPHGDPEIPIKRFVHWLIQEGLSSFDFMIQFIAFGTGNEIDLPRLEHLDSGLGLPLDIVDTVPSTGNVWKMLFGSLHKGFDAEGEKPTTNDLTNRSPFQSPGPSRSSSRMSGDIFRD